MHEGKRVNKRGGKKKWQPPSFWGKIQKEGKGKMEKSPKK